MQLNRTFVAAEEVAWELVLKVNAHREEKFLTLALMQIGITMTKIKSRRQFRLRHDVALRTSIPAQRRLSKVRI